MAALVQTHPQQSGTVTLLHTRTSSTPMIMPGSSHALANQTYGNPQRGSYHGLSGSVSGQGAYRSNTPAPIQPYAFTSTPSLANGGQSIPNGGYRTSSGTTVPTLSQTNDPRMQQTAAPAPMTRPQLNGTSNQPTFAQVVASKASPERYRRPAPKQTDSSPAAVQMNSAAPSGSGMATVVHLYNPRAVPQNLGVLPNRPHSAYGSQPGMAMDDMHLHRYKTEEEAKKFRRRSIHSINSADYFNPPSSQSPKQTSGSDSLGIKNTKTAPRIVPLPPPSRTEKSSGLHARSNSSDSVSTSRSSNSRPSSANRNSNASPPTGSPASSLSIPVEKASTQEQAKLVNIPPRGSSTDVGKRALNSSPLSNPANMTSESSTDGAGMDPASPIRPPTSSRESKVDSEAARQLAAINDRGTKSKSKTSRLRRAFSFGSAAELRKASGQDAGTTPGVQIGQSKLHKEQRPEDAYEEEQARIAQKQEEGGIGSSIYSGTKLFSGSTDNLSISSTASSASIMLRKMGRGVKKGGRSLAGLFRPKSIIGSPTEELSAPEVSPATVSMVTVEAERDRVNVTTNAELPGSNGTGFPHLERNSMDATRNPESLNPDRLNSTSTENSRKSIVGGEKERAEVLATIRKGILKTRSNSPTPTTENKAPTFELPPIPNVTDSPESSAPSTPKDETPGHKRNGSVAIGSEDYFMTALRVRQDTKSAPVTPQASQKRNATFSPRIIFHDTWPPAEYDRRGEIATANRLTPMLAQQIREEINSFKMEMEVHETSKIYTHFF